MRNNKGFTLVEIMIVVVIIGLLAALAIPAFKKIRENAIQKTVINDARLIGQTAATYFLDNPGETSVTITTLLADGLIDSLSAGVVPGTDEQIDVADDATVMPSFQLQHPQINGGADQDFNVQGQP